MFGPYTPLQQLDLLADDGTKSYVVGSTNSLLLQQKDRYSDILINVSSPLPFWVITLLTQFVTTSLMKIALVSHLYLSETLWPSPRPTDAGLIFSLKLLMTLGMKNTRHAQRPLVLWAPRSSFDCSLRSTCWLYYLP